MINNLLHYFTSRKSSLKENVHAYIRHIIFSLPVFLSWYWGLNLESRPSQARALPLSHIFTFYLWSYKVAQAGLGLSL